jgi:CubicO group peptidase (beta-lactamase class C family)
MPLPLTRAWLLLWLAATPAFAAPAPDFSAIAPKMQSFVDQGIVAGVVTLVADKDNVLHLAAVGKSDVSIGRPMQTNDLFWIASMSKPMTAVAVAMLKDEGKLSFDDPVAKYLPEFQDLWLVTNSTADTRTLARPPRPITLRDLLTHTSGLGEYRVTGPHWTLAEMAKVFSREPLRFAPGTRWSYSTAGLDTLGRVVEVVSGMPFDQFMQTRLFDPLGMKDTTFWVDPKDFSRFATPYNLEADTNRLQPAVITYMYGTEVTDRGRPPLGGAGLFSTAEDVAKFYQMILNHGSFHGKQILQPDTVAEMLTKQTGDLRARAGMPWGLGFCVIEDPSAFEANAMLAPGSYGHGGAFGTNSWVDPKRGAIFVMMLERAGLRNPDASPMHVEFQKAAAAALDAAAPPAPSATPAPATPTAQN